MQCGMLTENSLDLMVDALTGRYLLSHPFYRRWEEGGLAEGELGAYAEQYRLIERELPLTLAPAVYLEDIGGYYVQPKFVGSTLNAFLINVYAPGGAIVSGAYNTAVTSGNVILTMQKRRV